MKVESIDSELLAALEFVEEGGSRFFERFGFGVTEVNEIGVVWENVRGVNFITAMFFKSSNAFGGQRRACPLALVFGEECEGIRPDGFGILRRILYAAAGADVRADKFLCRFHSVH